MTTFDEEKFEEKYVHYFEELERAYSNAFSALHGTADSTLLRAIDRQVMSESEPVYDGDGQFTVQLPDDPQSMVDGVQGSEHQFTQLLDQFVELVETELQEIFEFEPET